MWPASSQVSTKWERNITHCKLSRQTMMRAHLVMNLRIPGCPKGEGRGLHVGHTKLQFSTPRHQGHMWGLCHIVWCPVDYRALRMTLLYCLMAGCNWTVPSNASRAIFMSTLRTSVRESAGANRLPLLHALERAPNNSRGIDRRSPPRHSTTTCSWWHFFASTMMK